MNGQEWLALAIVLLVAFLQVRSWAGGGRRAAKRGGATCGSCSGCPSQRSGATDGGAALAPAAQGACH